MRFNSEIYVSIDGNKYHRLELTKNESVNIKYTFKDTNNLSKIFSPYSQSFTFKGSLHNQRILDFFGNTSVITLNRSNIFYCKIYINSLLSESGLLKINDIRYNNGRVLSFTGNFTTELLSLNERIGNDLISDLPNSPVFVDSSANAVKDSLSFIQEANTEPIEGVKTRYYTPLISTNRVFQIQPTDGNGEFLDNVYYNQDRVSSDSLKADELRHAINGKSIIEMILSKYNLNVTMPIINESYFNHWFIWCNGISESFNKDVYFDIKNELQNPFVLRSKNRNHFQYGSKYSITTDLQNNTFNVVRWQGANSLWKNYFDIFLKFKGVKPLNENEDVQITAFIEREDGLISSDVTEDVTKSETTLKLRVTDDLFLNNEINFKIKIKTSTNVIWSDSDFLFDVEAYDGKFGPFNKSGYVVWRTQSLLNDNSSEMNNATVNLYDSIPKTKVTDFLKDFFKAFNISVFTDGNKLFWLTPKDLKANNKEYSKKEVDYTKYLQSLKTTKEVANDYNYYNFKHKTDNYKSNVDYKALRGIEFGQLTYPSVKPTRQLKEFKIETNFSIIEALPIAGAERLKTSYGFTSDKPEILDNGAIRYTPNTENLTIFFANNTEFLGEDERIGITGINRDNEVAVLPLNYYVRTSPIHQSGFSFGFGLIQEATEQSLYFNFYKEQTERLLNPNVLTQTFKLELPANELVLNYSSDNQGESNVPDGFRLQNDVIIQEKRYSIVEATIDKTTGKTSIKLLNY